MVMFCCAINCTSKSGVKAKEGGITFHRFPKDKAKMMKWVVAVHRSDASGKLWRPGPHARVCSCHFEEKCFDRTGQSTRLRLDAVPSIFEFSEHVQNIGKGSLWMVDPQFRPNLLQALRKTPYHPYHQLHALRASNNQSSPDDLPYGSKGHYQAQRQNVNLPPPDLFPLLSKRLAASSIKSEVSDFDAAAAMLSLKHANERKRSPFPVNLWRRNSRGVLEKVRHYRPKRKRPLVVTHSPYDDHTYSVAEDAEQSHHCSSPTSSIDEEFDFGSDCDTDSEISEYTDSDSATSSPGKRKRLKDEEDEKKKTEGADALLNLAGIATPMSDVRSMFNMSSESVPPSSTDVIVSTTVPSNDSDTVPGADALLRLAGVTSNIVPLRSISPTNNNNIEVKNELHLDTCCVDKKS